MARGKTKKKEEAASVSEEAKDVVKGAARKIVVEEVAEPSKEEPVVGEAVGVDSGGGEKAVDTSVETETAVSAGPSVVEEVIAPVETGSVPEESAEVLTEGDAGNESGEQETEPTNRDDGEEPIEEKKKDGYSFKVLFVMFMVGAICSGLILGGVLYFRSNTGGEPTPKPTLTPVVEDGDEATPAPTPDGEELDLTEYKVQVLNGSGVAGIAGSTASTLEDAGFEDVVAGNASTQDYKGVEVGMKADVETGVYDAITDALSEYEVIEVDELDEDSTYDVVVIVGAD